MSKISYGGAGGDMETHSNRSGDDRLPMSSFLHTIPEGSSDIGATTSPFNPEAAETARSPSVAENSPWAAMMRPFRTSQSSSARPAAPGSVASSTRAVEAGNAGVDEKSNPGSDAGALFASGMDGSLTAVAGLGEDTEHEQADPKAVRTPGKRRRSSITRASKRKVGVVCMAALLVVVVVIIVLVIIVKQLDNESNTETTPANSTADAQLVNGTDASASSNSTTNLQEPTLAPTVAESTYVYGSGSSSNTLQPTVPNDDIVDDDATFDDTLTEEQSLLVQLDEAIYMLYTAEESQLNMLPHVSSEVFSNGRSPRYQAREWLLNNDTLLQSTIMESSSSSQPPETLERIAQRYIMLVFYFSTREDTASTNAANNANTGPNRQLQQDSARFEIYPDVHECFWVTNACGQEADSAAANGNDVQVQSMIAASSELQLTNEFVTYLNVSHANLHGTLPFELGYLSGLRELALHGNNLSGSIPELLLTQLQYLYVLDLSQNSFQGTIPPALWTLPTLRFAYLHGNNLAGTIPQSLPSSPSSDLEEIWLRDNRLSGSIPQWWTELPNLDVLSVRNNSWTGRLPQQWSEAAQLEFLDISYNQLTGTIPPSLLYGVSALQHLYLDFNQLVGTLPTIESALSQGLVAVSRSDLKMQALWLQYNQLSGTIPTGFGWEWSRLQELELYGNQLSGVWECLEEKESDEVWPLLEELAVDCSSSQVQNAEQQEVNLTQPTGTTGVDMSFCTACCIKCF